MYRQQTTQTVYHWFNQHRQLIYRLARGLAEVVQFLSIRSSVEGPTDIGAVQPSPDEILIVNHRLLDTREPRAHRRRRGGNVPWSL